MFLLLLVGKQNKKCILINLAAKYSYNMKFFRFRYISIALSCVTFNDFQFF